MQTNASRPPALSNPLPVLRRRRGPIVEHERRAGHRSGVESEYERIYYGPASDLGQLGHACWFRMRERAPWSRADAWRISLKICGASIHLDAVIDDFGSLVVVSQ